MPDLLLDDLDAPITEIDGLEGTARVDAILEQVDRLRTRAPDAELDIVERALEMAREIRYERGVAMATGLRGRTYYSLSRHNDAIRDLLDAIAYFDAAGDRDQAAVSRGVLAAVYSSQGCYEEAMALALESLDAARERGDNESVGWILHGLSGAYIELGHTEEALTSAMEALATQTAVGHVIGQARAHSAVGTALRTTGRFEEARGHHEVSLQLFREDDDMLGESRAYHDLGLVAYALTEFESALEYHSKAVALRRRLGNRQAECTSQTEIGRTLVALGRKEEAFDVLYAAQAIAEELELRPKLIQVHLVLAEACEAAGELAKALEHYRLYHDIHEEVLGSQVSGRIQSMQVRYEAERARQEAEIERLRNVELHEKNEQLESLLAELRKAQNRLVQSEKLASLGRVTSGIAHEIKNPLNFVVNFAELNAEMADEMGAVLEARRDELPEDIVSTYGADFRTLTENTARMLEHARRADGIIKSMLGHVRHTGGSHRPTDLNALLTESVEAAFGDANGKAGIAITWEIDPKVKAIALTPQSMQRAFVNVLENARYAVLGRAELEANGFVPSIEIKTKRLPGMVQVRISDNGFGIPAENCTRVFEPFFTTKPTGEGTGLGLSLAYDIVTQGHGGSMAAISKEGEGATLVVTLPDGEG